MSQNNTNQIGDSLFDMNKNVMRCPIESHEMQRLKYMCIDPNCKLPQKEGCADCFLDEHAGHQRIDMEQFVGKLKGKFGEAYQTLENVQKEVKMEDFKEQIDQDIETQFEEIKGQVMGKFDEFKIDLKHHLEKKLYFKNDCLENLKVNINSMKGLSQEKFHNLEEQQVQQCINFYYESEGVKKGLEDSQIMVSRVKNNILKSKNKYFEKLRNLWSDILQEHSQDSQQQIQQQQQNNKNSDEDDNHSVQSYKRGKGRKRVSFAPDTLSESPNKDTINQAKMAAPRKKLKTNTIQQQNIELQQQQEEKKIVTEAIVPEQQSIH